MEIGVLLCLLVRSTLIIRAAQASRVSRTDEGGGRFAAIATLRSPE
jgi:hypothetical protein